MKRIVIAVILLLLTYNSNAQKALECWMAGNAVTLAEVEQFGVDNCFAVCQIDDKTFARMKGKSYKAECTIPRSELRYIKALHITQDGAILMGEMVVNRAIAENVVTILRRLYEAILLQSDSIGQYWDPESVCSRSSPGDSKMQRDSRTTTQGQQFSTFECTFKSLGEL